MRKAGERRLVSHSSGEPQNVGHCLLFAGVGGQGSGPAHRGTAPGGMDSHQGPQANLGIAEKVKTLESTFRKLGEVAHAERS